MSEVYEIIRLALEREWRGDTALVKAVLDTKAMLEADKLGMEQLEHVFESFSLACRYYARAILKLEKADIDGHSEAEDLLTRLHVKNNQCAFFYWTKMFAHYDKKLTVWPTKTLNETIFTVVGTKDDRATVDTTHDIMDAVMWGKFLSDQNALRLITTCKMIYVLQLETDADAFFVETACAYNDTEERDSFTASCLIYADVLTKIKMFDFALKGQVERIFEKYDWLADCFYRSSPESSEAPTVTIIYDPEKRKLKNNHPQLIEKFRTKTVTVTLEYNKLQLKDYTIEDYTDLQELKRLANPDMLQIMTFEMFDQIFRIALQGVDVMGTARKVLGRQSIPMNHGLTLVRGDDGKTRIIDEHGREIKMRRTPRKWQCAPTMHPFHGIRF